MTWHSPIIFNKALHQTLIVQKYCELNVSGFLSTYRPCDAVAINLQEAEKVLSFLSITGLLLSCQRIVGHQQMMCSSTWNRKQTLYSDMIKSVSPLSVHVRADRVEGPVSGNHSNKGTLKRNKHAVCPIHPHTNISILYLSVFQASLCIICDSPLLPRSLFFFLAQMLW